MANATIVYACTTGGLAILNRPGTLDEWLPARIALEGRSILAAWADPGPPIRVIAAASEPQGPGQLLASENGGREWETRLEAPVTAVLGLPGDGGLSRLYAGMDHGGIAVSTDGGRDWGVLAGAGTSSIHRMAPGSEAGLIYIVTGEGDLLEGDPEEGTWRVLSIDGAADLTRDTSTGDLYAATSDGVAMSADGGTSWAVLPGSPAELVCLAVIPGPGDSPATLLTANESGLFLSPDGGNWQPLEVPGPGVTVLTRDPERRDRLYAGTASGHVYESGNRGQSWQPLNLTPLPPIAGLYVIRI